MIVVCMQLDRMHRRDGADVDYSAPPVDDLLLPFAGGANPVDCGGELHEAFGKNQHLARPRGDG